MNAPHRRLAALIALALLAGPAAAQNWQALGASGKGDELAVDEDSQVLNPAGISSARFRLTHAQAGTLGDRRAMPAGWLETIQFEARCSEGTSRQRTLNAIVSAGGRSQLLPGDNRPLAGPFTPPQPGTQAATMAAWLCTVPDNVEAAHRWQPILPGSQGDQIAVDAPSLRQGRDGIASGWFKLALAQPLADGDPLGRRPQTIVYRVEARCADQLARFTATRLFTGKDNQSPRFGAANHPLDTPYTPVDPGTAGAVMSSYLCPGNAQPSQAAAAEGKQS
ncbi:hypothetical protein SAMN02745857_02794 [Andreprevotia lacus DSM 23236]|jgi:hypothetical protein|uniref:Uncharacterized protein n=1 Tax=Andreprevotia lacus DSM 23236 TaxID=1121001 RepID=A0A1W1XTS8_9NEIS|nr:hypothetical protein [Andreprevotia lacus]SMC27297.1 hypothetical protein SAMN02745857_02794 [Andreprevotia lacus DSM 23236]